MNANPPIVLNADGRLPGIITVDHAGRSIPDALGDLGLDAPWSETHHFCDLGAAELAYALAERIDVPIVLCDVSRLVIDVNRWIEDPRSVVSEVEGTPIPGNLELDTLALEARQEAIFWPYQSCLGEIWMQKKARHEKPFFFSLHSCTRVFDGFRRPWDGGTIWHDDSSLSRHLITHLSQAENLVLGDNQPYSGLTGAYTVDRHTYGSGLPACGFEVTNDLIETEADVLRWADLLSDALLATIKEGLAA